MPVVLAVESGEGITPEVTTENFPPLVWMCDNRIDDSRIVMDDNTEPGRLDGQLQQIRTSSYTIFGNRLDERINNYAFEGEQILWSVLVLDKNGIEKIKDVHVTIGQNQGSGNDIEANCILDGVVTVQDRVPERCNARIGEEMLWDFTNNTAAFYECILTVETPDSMYGEFWVTVEAEDQDGLKATLDENEFWFFNPVVALSIDGNLKFDNVRPGTDTYSKTMLVGNDADEGSGVLLDMFISGTDFYDSSNSGAKCPTTNQLPLSSFRYFATNGAYSSADDALYDNAPGNDIARNTDAEGYTNIDYGIGFNNPNSFYDNAEIIQAGSGVPPKSGNMPSPLIYWPANILAPGAEMSLTFKLSLPEPCNGNFDSGEIFFWGEAI